MSEATRKQLYMFWELIDEVMNAVLFLLIGLELLVLPLHYRFIAAGAIAIAIVPLCRWLSVATSVTLMRAHRKPERGRITVLTWGGLRGGLPVAMALSLPNGEYRNLILAITYAVVVFCIFVQGLSAGAVIRWALGRRVAPLASPAPALSSSHYGRA
jgi:CPA1 family monovalent cation:H+ antiporter